MILRIKPSCLRGYVTPLKSGNEKLDAFACALWLSFSLFCPEFVVSGISASSPELKRFLKLIENSGVKVGVRMKGIALEGEVNSISDDLSDCPELIPIAALLSTVSQGICCLSVDEADEETRNVFNYSAQMVEDLGADSMMLYDRLMVKGNGKKLLGGIVNTRGDYRIAASAALAGLVSEGEISVSSAESINRVYPKFWQTYRVYGGNVYLKEHTGEVEI